MSKLKKFKTIIQFEYDPDTIDKWEVHNNCVDIIQQNFNKTGASNVAFQIKYYEPTIKNL